MHTNRAIDLMIPGLVPGPTGTLPELDQGDLVAITVKGYR
jgi:translation initiation factor 2D